MDVCKDSEFCCSLIDGNLQLKRHHPYYCQVQLFRGKFKVREASFSVGLAGTTWNATKVYHLGLLIDRLCGTLPSRPHIVISCF